MALARLREADNLRWAAAPIVALAILAAACGGSGAAALGGKPVMRLAGKLTDRGMRPVAGAVVTLCQLQPEELVSLNSEWPGCDRELALATTQEDGAFALEWPGTSADVALSSLLFRQPGYAVRVMAAQEFAAAAKESGTEVAIERAPTVQATFLRAENREPIANAEYGWFVQDGPVLRVRYFECCSDERGRFDLNFEHRPDVEVWVFAIERGTARYALARLAVKPEMTLPLALEATKALRIVRGQALASDGRSIAGAISIAPRGDSGDGLFDRVLAIIQGGATDTAGHFEFRLASSEAVSVTFSAWAVGDGSRHAHVARHVLATQQVTVGSGIPEILLRASPERIVTCSLANADGAALVIEELGLSFGPHLGWGHSDSCVTLRRAGQATSVVPDAVRVPWPLGAETLSIEARATTRVSADQPPRVLAGTVRLDAADVAECRIRVNTE